MSSADIPLRVEVMGWNHQRLADYLRRHRLSGCDRAVLKGSITGAQFLKMTEYDLQVFPCMYIPKVTQIQRDINRSEPKKSPRYKLLAQFEPKPVLEQEEETWNTDEFDNDSQHDGSQSEEEGDRYLCPQRDLQTDEPYDSGEDYETLAEEEVEPTRFRRAAPHPDTHYKDDYRPIPAERPSKPLRMNKVPIKPKIPDSKPALPIDRTKKPGQHDISLNKSKGSTVEASGSSTSKGPASLLHKASKYISGTRTRAQPPEIDKSTPEPDKDLDPSWYAGKITRHQAEFSLREMNKDGTFVVRDSSRGSDEHPFTLMLLKQGKIYNIKIQNQGKSYILGTGLKNTKSFPGVREMITHHMHTPLQLIDATDPNQTQQNQCCLLYPAGV